jgi:hypothetical protein
MPVRWSIPLLIAVLITVPACGPTYREGPNVAGVPEGFRYDANMTSGRPVLPNRTQIGQSGWITPFAEEHSSIMFTQYSGAADEAEVRAVLDAYARRYTHQKYGAVEAVTIDKRPAWGWYSEQHLKGKLASLEYTAVIPYDDVTWAVEFYASHPRHRDPELLKKLVTSFHYHRKRS